MFSKFFEKDLNNLEKTMLELGPENKSAAELLQIIKTGKKEHGMKHSLNVNP